MLWLRIDFLSPLSWRLRSWHGKVEEVAESALTQVMLRLSAVDSVVDAVRVQRLSSAELVGWRHSGYRNQRLEQDAHAVVHGIGRACLRVVQIGVYVQRPDLQ